MKSFNIVYGQHGKYSAVIHATSYINPIEDIELVSAELREHVNGECEVLFDLLLTLGDEFNRFAEAHFDGENIQIESAHIVEIPPDEVQECNKYYRGRIAELENSVLSSRERRHFAGLA